MTREQLLLRQLDKSARRYHAARLLERAPDHRYWTFEHCPAPDCREARHLLGGVQFPDFDLLPERPVTSRGIPRHGSRASSESAAQRLVAEPLSSLHEPREPGDLSRGERDPGEEG